MTDLNVTTKPHRGLSPSSMSLFTGCQRKYWHKKIAKTPIDADASEDTVAFNVGKAFHRALEVTLHDLNAFSLKEMAFICAEFDLLPEEYAPMIYAMLSQYRIVHEASKLHPLACESIVETDSFYGIVDAVMEGEDGAWWIVDMKTAGQWSDNTINTLRTHPQLNLYAQHYKEIAKRVNIDPEKYAGCRYRVTTKSKLKQRSKETFADYIARMSDGIISYDFILPRDIMIPEEIYAAHAGVVRHLETFKEKGDYAQNFGNCMAYFKPCEFWSQCSKGRLFTESNNLQVVRNR